MFRNLLLAAALLMFAGCSSFHREWKEAAKTPVPAGSMAGRWDGSWQSGKNGHHGRLRCVMTQVDTNRYHAHFHATFWKIFRGAYEVELIARGSSEAGVAEFSGQSDLGWLYGGVYRYEGKASATNFFSSYRCKIDHGTFQMSRPSEP